jgi:flagellin
LVGVDFAVESSNFSKANVLAQAGTYALQKAQQVVKNVFKLLEV